MNARGKATALLATFDSIGDMARHIDAAPHQDSAGDASQKPGYRAWDFGLGFRGAMDMALNGAVWVEGGRNLQRIRVETDRLSARAPVSSPVRAMAGYRPSVPAYLAGQPRAMWARAEGAEQKAKVIRMGVACHYSHAADASDVLNRGAAIMSAVDSLESEGFRVEVSAVALSVDKRDAGAHRFETLIKGADQDWIPATVAFALAHPAFNRRLIFALKERTAETVRNTQLCYNDESADWVDGEGFDIWVPRFGADMLKREAFSTPEKALRTIEAIVAGDLVDMQEEAA